MAKPNWKTNKHPPIEDPAGYNCRCRRRAPCRRPVLTTLYDRVAVMLAAGAVAAAAIQHPTYTAMWGESITPFAQRVVLAQHASCLNAPTAVK